ncbi:MAG: trypsin-like peptidase domain-containing protein [Lachnospiraceae bacterium]|nr:trypsin-like peptidase domain-containing protein [Lachnospiraceae bacterium]
MKVKKVCYRAAAILAGMLFLNGCSVTIDTENRNNSIESYQVQYDLNGGTLIEGELLQTVQRGDMAKEPKTEREGYKFDGWTRSSENIISDRVITAKWKTAYRVEFDPAGGELVSGELIQQVGEGDLPRTPAVSKPGMNFKGWSPAVRETYEEARYEATWSRIQSSASEIFKLISPAVAEVTIYDEGGQEESFGSGFFVDGEGKLVTNYHVMEGAYSATALLSDGNEYEITDILASNRLLDLAIVQVDISGNEHLVLSDTSVMTGETVYALGSSRGFTGTFSQGIVSNAARYFGDEKYIQITAPISPGNSGGPLVNVYGDVVGINTMTYAEGQNLNFAIDIAELGYLDMDSPMTIEEFYEQTSYEEAMNAAAEKFLSQAEYYEAESNDSYPNADGLTGDYSAGSIYGVEDIDIFYVITEKPGEILFEAVPFRIQECDALDGQVTMFKDDNYEDINDLEVLDTLTPSEDYDFSMELVSVIEADTPGIYFLELSQNLEYETEEPVYYLARATFIEKEDEE